MMMTVTVTAFGQKSGYELTFNMEGCPNGTAILAYYYGNKQYIKDSTKVDASGKFVFKGDGDLDQGIYLAVMPPDNKYFEVIVDEDQQFTMASKYTAPVKGMKVTGSDENKRFYDYLNFLEKQKAKSKPLTVKAEELKKADSLGYAELPEFKELQEKMGDIDEEVKEYKNKFIEDNPNALLTKVFLAS